MESRVSSNNVKQWDICHRDDAEGTSTQQTRTPLKLLSELTIESGSAILLTQETDELGKKRILDKGNRRNQRYLKKDCCDLRKCCATVPRLRLSRINQSREETSTL
jgi:hypothetical protein